MELKNYRELRAYCRTTVQKENLEAVIKYGSANKAAKATNKTRRTIDATIKRLEKYAKTHTPDGLRISGKSTLHKYNDPEDGGVLLEWVKTKDSDIQLDELKDMIVEEFQENITKAPKIPPPKNKLKKDTLTLYPLGDPHVGMYAWAAETGDDFDCDIAERNLITAMSELVNKSPDSETAIVLNVGDFFHSDYKHNTTTKGTPVDVDSRWSRVLRIGIKLMRTCVELALEKHKYVIVRNVIGNHDEHTSMVLAIALDQFFENNPRVQIETQPTTFWYYRFGKVLFGATHGDTCKPDKLPLVMAEDAAKDWGDTEFRYWHTGHVHHDIVKEFVGCKFEAHRTLAAKDAWHTSQGYRSKRDMKSITYHKKYGEISRFTMSIAEVHDAIKGG